MKTKSDTLLWIIILLYVYRKHAMIQVEGHYPLAARCFLLVIMCRHFPRLKSESLLSLPLNRLNLFRVIPDLQHSLAAGSVPKPDNVVILIDWCRVDRMPIYVTQTQ